ncbi:hypothetical protein T484DRAFT_1926581 [Baffinella frigidus]|nr:hypothetical protein T484DRAFT_1926581 [Cryptophyta sp. CCMP2293]
MVASTPTPSVVSQKSSSHKDGHVLVYADDLKRMFHLPLADAAGKIGLCQTTFKKTCRRLGISAWPYQKGATRRTAHKDTHLDTSLRHGREQAAEVPVQKNGTIAR